MAGIGWSKVFRGLPLASFLILSPVMDVEGAQEASHNSDSFLFLTGLVVRADGTAFGNPEIQVELVCGGRVQQQVFISDKGAFSFSLERTRQPGWVDASVGGDGALNRDSHWNSSRDKSGVFAASSFKTFNLSGCVIRLTGGQGYSSTEIALSNRSVFDNPDVGVLVIGVGGGGAAAVASVTTLQAPPKAREAYEKAKQELAEERPDYGRAARELKKAVKEYPEFAAAWHQLGEIQLRENRVDSAEESFERAIDGDATFLEAHLALARLSLFREDWRRALDLAGKAVELAPHSPQAHYFRGLAGYFLKRFKESEEDLAFVKTRGHQARYPLALFHLAVIHAQSGRFQESGDEFREYLALMPEHQLPAGQKDQIVRQLEAWEASGAWQRDSDSTLPQ